MAPLDIFELADCFGVQIWIYDVTMRALFSIELNVLKTKLLVVVAGLGTGHSSFLKTRTQKWSMHNIPVLVFHLCKILIYLFFALRFKCIFPIKNKRFTSVIRALNSVQAPLVHYHYQQYLYKSTSNIRKFSK